MDATFTAILWVITFCTQPMAVQADGKCDDGTTPHKLEMRLLNGNSSSPSLVYDLDKMKVESLFVLLRDEQEIARLPASLVTADEAHRLLQLAWPGK